MANIQARRPDLSERSLQHSHHFHLPHTSNVTCRLSFVVIGAERSWFKVSLPLSASAALTRQSRMQSKKVHGGLTSANRV